MLWTCVLWWSRGVKWQSSVLSCASQLICWIYKKWMQVLCARAQERLSDGGGADAGRGRAPRHPPGARFYCKSGRCGCLCASSPGSPSANRAAPPESAPAGKTHKRTSVRVLHGCRCCRRCKGEACARTSKLLTGTQRCGWSGLTMAQTRRPGDIRLGWRTRCASDKDSKLPRGEETRRHVLTSGKRFGAQFWFESLFQQILNSHLVQDAERIIKAPREVPEPHFGHPSA